VVALGVAAGGCFYTSNGLSPPTEQLYFPTGMVVSPDRSALFVANSDFDLQYNGGTVQVLDLATIRASVGTILAGVRCTQGYADECATFASDCAAQSAAPAYASEAATTFYCPPSPTPGTTTVGNVCNSVRMSLANAGPSGTACTAPSECTSGNCVIGSDGVDGFCEPCVTGEDCPASSGVCAAGICVLDVATNQILSPAACTPLNPPFRGFDSIGAFASGAVLAQSPTPGGGSRLFVPVRGDPSITWFDVSDDRTAAGLASPYLLDCGAAGTLQRCDDEHRVGVDPYDNFRDETLPVQPVGLDVSSDGQWIVSAHQITGSPAIGLSNNSWTSGLRPAFEYYLTGEVAAGPTEVAHIPPAAIVSRSQSTSTPIVYQPAFLVTYDLTPEIDIVTVDDDHESSPPRPFLTRSQAQSITVDASGSDSRGVALDASERQACENACLTTLTPGATTCQSVLPQVTSCCPNQPDVDSCLLCCVDTPLRVFVANRQPPTLLIGNVTTTIVDSDVGGITGSSAYDLVQITGNASLSVGPSKVALGKVIVADGSLRTRVFAVTFDTRFIYVFDPLAPNELPPQPIRTGRGPDSIAFDACCDPTIPTCLAADACPAGQTPHAYLYVAHFTDSYLGVVDLDMRRPETYATMFASIGVPLPPLESH
jgi:hypothetical protein